MHLARRELGQTAAHRGQKLLLLSGSLQDINLQNSFYRS